MAYGQVEVFLGLTESLEQSAEKLLIAVNYAKICEDNGEPVPLNQTRAGLSKTYALLTEQIRSLKAGEKIPSQPPLL